MKKWNIKVKSNPQEIIKKLDAAFESFSGFIFKKGHDSQNSVTFNFRKPITYPDQILHRNRIVVNGKIIKTKAENEADIEISFAPHLFMTLTVLSIVILGVALIVLISSMSDTTSVFMFGGALLLVGTVLWVALKKKFETDTQKYKTLISEILEIA